MTFRSYKIKLKLQETARIQNEVPTLFNVLISDPSNLVPAGNTKLRGLSFLDKDGILLQSTAFKHVPTMAKLPYPITEEDEISNIILQSLHLHYKLMNKDVVIHISRI